VTAEKSSLTKSATILSPFSGYSTTSHHFQLRPAITNPTQSSKCFHDSIHLPKYTSQTMARRRRPPRPGALTELPPLKIFSQIVLLQAIWYIAATALILFTALVAGKSFSFDMVLSWRSLRGDTTVGWMLGLVWLLNSFIGYAALSPSSLTRALTVSSELSRFYC
jgi:hypothetical protein